MRLNSQQIVNRAEAEIEWSEGMSFNTLMKMACKKFGNKEKVATAKLFSKSGVQLFPDDIEFIRSGDILYLAMNGKCALYPAFRSDVSVGEEFNYNAILDDYKIIRDIGQGGFGKVVLGKHKENGSEVAIKFMDISENRKLFDADPSAVTQANMVEEIYREADALKKLNHKNIIALHNALVQGKEVIMIMEYASGGELLEFVETHEGGFLKEREARNIFIQIVNAILYCHNRNIIHRDLKLENVLLKRKDDLQIKIVDFGIAGVCAANKKDKNDAGSLAYMPPEVNRFAN